MRLRNAILVAVVALLGACGGEDSDPSTGLEKGRFGDTCGNASDCVGLKYGQLSGDNPALRESIQCAAAAGPPLCRFSCEAPGGSEACVTLGGTCESGVCLP